MADTSSSPAASCRLYVILARAAPVGVVFRRGPSKRVRLLLWHTQTDTFTPGQWFHGRLYERRCDVSPDGKHLVYFAAKHTTRQLLSDFTDAWTAISRPPYLTALALWPKGDCWNGGGLWNDDGSLVLNHRPFQSVPHPDFPPPPALQVVSRSNIHGEDDPLWSDRLTRDGWRLEQQTTASQYLGKAGYVRAPPTVWSKTAPGGQYRLIHTISGVGASGDKGWYQETFVLRHRELQTDYPLPEGTSWVDWDARGRLVWAANGRLWATPLPIRSVQHDPLADAAQIADFCSMAPEPVVAPQWAREW